MLYRCVAAIPNGSGRCLVWFYEDTPKGRAEAEAFARKHDKPGMGVYDCVSLLREKRRIKDNVAQIDGLHADIDAYKIGKTKEEVVKQLQDGLEDVGILTKINSSGRGIHVHFLFREPIETATPEAEHAERVLKRLVAHLGADPQLTHFAALMRRLGTTNTKGNTPEPCKTLVDTGVRCKLSDIEAYLDLVSERESLFPSSESKQNGGGAPESNNEPVDVDARLAAMRFEDKDGAGVNATLRSVIPSLIWKGWHPADIFEWVFGALKQIVERDGLKWDMAQEEAQTYKRIQSAYQNLFEEQYDPSTGVIPVWLPMEFHEAWAAALAAGKRPVMTRNGAGWHIRAYGNNGEKTNSAAEDDHGAAQSESEELNQNDGPRAPFILRPVAHFDPAQIPPREFLFGSHYQRRTVSGTVAPGGTGKSSEVMVEAVAMKTGRDLLGEGAKEPLRVWYHNGEDNMLELQRRLAGICQHYGIPLAEALGDGFFMTSGNEVPLRVAETWSQVRLQTDHQLVKCITEAIGDNRIDVAILDPLVTLHSVPENNPGQMDQVIRIFTRMADGQNCAIDLSHHTRKLAPGSADDYGIDDMRGAGAVKDAMRAVRMLNVMSPRDAESAGLMELERTNYFRIDRAKANYSGPAKTATWRQFVNVDLPNGDAVGVVTPWRFPGQDGAPPSPEKAEAERKAEHVFLELLARLSLEGRFVNERSGPNNAPHVFAKEREARLTKVGKSALDAAMRRLFDKKKIRQEEYMRTDRHSGIRIVV